MENQTVAQVCDLARRIDDAIKYLRAYNEDLPEQWKIPCSNYNMRRFFENEDPEEFLASIEGIMRMHQCLNAIQRLSKSERNEVFGVLGID